MSVSHSALISETRQYQVTGYIGIGISIFFLVFSLVVHWRISRGKVFVFEWTPEILRDPKLITLVLACFNLLEIPQYEGFVRLADEAVPVDKFSYATHLLAVCLFYMAFALFMQLWQSPLQLSPKLQELIGRSSIALFTILFLYTCMTMVFVAVEGLSDNEFLDSVIYETYIWTINASGFIFSLGFLVYGFLLYTRVSGALSGTSDIAGRVLVKIVIVVLVSTTLLSLRLVMLIIYNVNRYQDLTLGPIDFGTTKKDFQLLWQFLSQFLPFGGLQLVMFSMLWNSRPLNDQGSSRSKVLKQSLLNSEFDSIDDKSTSHDTQYHYKEYPRPIMTASGSGFHEQDDQNKSPLITASPGTAGSLFDNSALIIESETLAPVPEIIIIPVEDPSPKSSAASRASSSFSLSAPGGSFSSLRNSKDDKTADLAPRSSELEMLAPSPPE